MKKYILFLFIVAALFACNQDQNDSSTTEDVQVEEKDPNRFADLKILKYDASGINDLTTKQKELVYYLAQAALSGREIIYAQNYKHNIQIKRTLEEIYKNYSGDKSDDNWDAFEVYLKRVWFSNGIHHHYAEKKLEPGFDESYFRVLVANSESANWPTLENETPEELIEKLIPVLFDPTVAAKKVVKDKGVDKVSLSAN